MVSLSQKYWEKNCGTYIKLLDNTDNYPSPYTQVIVPTVKKLVKSLSKTNDFVLDIGCGEGYLTRLIASQKRKTYGCDLSPEMIAAAKKQNSKITYWVQDIEKKNSNPKNSPRFKLIISNLVFTYLKNIDIALKNASQYLGTNGYLVIIIPHPCFYHQENYRWFMEENNKPYQVGKYLEEKTYIKEIANGVKTHYIHRTLQSYVDIFVKNKFNLVSLLEPQPEQLLNKVLKKVNEVPNLAFFVLKKL
jgi:trans-aconitate methyltransferase